MSGPSPAAFVKGLKTSNDVELAISAWNNQNLYIPSKGQFIASWALNRLLKHTDSLLDFRIWNLLESILLSSSPSTSSTPTTPQWLPPLLHKIPVVPILTSLIRAVSNKESKEREQEKDQPFSEILRSSERVLGVLLPLSYSKTRFDAVLDGLWASLDAISSSLNQNSYKNEKVQSLEDLVQLAMRGFRATFENATNKTKVYTVFLESHFRPWILSICACARTGRENLRVNLWQAGRDILCSAEGFKLTVQSLQSPVDASGKGKGKEDGKVSSDFFEQLNLVCKEEPVATALLPTLFADQLAAAKVHRTSLAQWKADFSVSNSYRAFESIYTSTDTVTDINNATIQGSDALLKILRVLLENQGLLSGNTDLIQALHATVLWTLSQLDHDHIKDVALRSLCILGQIDYQMIAPHIQRLLQAIAKCETNNAPNRELYDLILDYHSKTRTLDQLCEHTLALLPSLTIEQLESSPNLYQGDTKYSTYSRVASILNGGLFGVQMGSNLSTAISNFLTSSQIIPLVSTFNSKLQHHTASFQTYREGTHVNENGKLIEAIFVIRLASFVLPFIPFGSLSASTAAMEQLEATGSKTYNLVIKPALQLCYDIGNSNNSGLSMEFQLAGAMILRLVTSIVGSCPWIPLGDLPELVESYVVVPTTHAGDSNHVAEFGLESCRLLLRVSYGKYTTVSTGIFDTILNSLSSTNAPSWSGRGAGLIGSNIGAAYGWLLTGRWLPLFTDMATREQQSRLATIILSLYNPQSNRNAGFEKGDQPAITMDLVIHRLLQSATFWELEPIYGALLSAILDGTSKIELVKPDNLEYLKHDYDRNGLKSSSVDFTQDELEYLIRCFHILLYFPPDILKMTLARPLPRRAIILDLLVNSLPSIASTTTTSVDVLRLFASRRVHDDNPLLKDLLANPKITTALFTHQLNNSRTRSDTLVKATVEILKVAFPAVLRKSDPPTIIEFTELITSQLEKLHQGPGQEFAPLDSQMFFLECHATLLSSISQYLLTEKPLKEIGEACHNLASTTYEIIEDKLKKLTSEKSKWSLVPACFKVLRSCNAIALPNADEDLEPGKLDRYILPVLPLLLAVEQQQERSEKLLQAYIEMIWLIGDEMIATAAAGKDVLNQAQLMLSVYSITVSRLGLHAPLDNPLRQTIRKLQPAIYQTILEHLQEAIEATTGTTISSTSLALVHASSVLLVDSPEGGFRIAQSSISRYLSSFHELGLSWNDDTTSQNLELLSSIAHICQNKPELLQLSNLGSIWSLLAKVLQSSEPSGKYLQQSHPKVFNTIVQIVAALIRHRKDIVVFTLPHLAMILSCLMGCLRAVQPNLGHKQNRTVAHKLPSWISISHPLGASEASSLARLLVSLTTKTASRPMLMFSTNSDKKGGKGKVKDDARSLAKPFGHHAACVLGAYIDIANDPLCLISREVRRELVPGLNALCAMTGERGRDALMSTLDNGGKMILKAVWSVYDKQRYIGQG